MTWYLFRKPRKTHQEKRKLELSNYSKDKRYKVGIQKLPLSYITAMNQWSLKLKTTALTLAQKN